MVGEKNGGSIFTERRGDIFTVKKIKKTQNFKNHIAVRLDTFKDFKELKDEPGSDAFLKKLLRLYLKYLVMKEKKREKKKDDKSI